jgi:hypothetical protein
MPRVKGIIGHLFAIALTGAVATATDDVEVITSSGSVLSIYSYGAARRAGVTPEFKDPKRPAVASTAALTDVVANPPLSLSQPASIRPNGRPTNPATVSTPPKRSAFNPIAPATRYAPRGQTAVQNSTQSTPSISVTWDPSPDDSVVGYRVYSGNVSGQYTASQALGDQTTADVAINGGTVYIAVTAYTADGIESALSEELLVAKDSQDGSIASAVLGSASR